MAGPVPFGRYQLERRLAVGGMAELMLARAPGPVGSSGSAEHVVIKRIIPARADDRHYVRMLADEAKVAQLLSHPNIVQVHEFGEVDGQAFIAMEYLTGDDLETVISQATLLERPIDVAIACYVIAEVAEGLHHAHTATDEQGKPLNVVHRDVSPANIIVTSHGAIKIVDFGIAKHDMESTATESGVIKGKIGYMSPEQTRGHELDGKSDVFSLGVVFFELLALRPCFHGASLPATIDAIRNGTREPIRLARPGLPEPVARLVDFMLTTDRRKRCPTAAEVSRSLQRYLAEAGVPTSHEVKTHISALTERTILAAPRVHSTFADPQVAVGEAFAAPDLVMDSDSLKTLVTGAPTRPDAPAPRLRALERLPEPHALIDETTEGPGIEEGRFSYGAPPDTRIISLVLLRMRRAGIERAVNRLRLLLAELRHAVSKQPPLAYAAVGLAAMAVGLGLTLALRQNPAPLPTSTVEPVDPATFAPLATPATGRLRLDTEPPGAVVTLNGERQATLTPLTLDNLPIGVTQDVTIELKGYHSVTREVTLEPADGGRLYFLVNLVPDAPPPTPTAAPEPPAHRPKPSTSRAPLEKGKLLIDVKPWADIYIKGHKVGTTPLPPIELPEGEYKVRIVNPEMSIDRTLPVTILHGKTTRVIEKL